MQTRTHSKEDMFLEAKRYCAGLVPHERATVLALSGDLGAGKTTFAQGIARAYALQESVTSPTFVIQKTYRLERVPGMPPFERLVHMDAYRLNGAHDLSVLGWDELLEHGKTLVVLEWPEQVAGGVPVDAHHIHFTFIDEHTREITYP